MILKAIDLGLMAEHLTIHKGVLGKLKLYYCLVQNPNLKQVIYEQLVIMRNHVHVMLMLIDPEQNKEVTVSALNQVQPITINCKAYSNHMGDKSIALEAQHTAMSMAHDNFSSALKMKADNVRDIHLHMALQQVRLQERYTSFINEMGWGYSPDISLEEQKNTLKMFKKMFDI